MMSTNPLNGCSNGTVRLLPLLFDRVNEGRHPLSTAPLFKLPFEILGLITQYVCPTSLYSLALVSRDCRQIARSRQFAHVVLDFRKASSSLITLLLAEGQERAENGGPTLAPALGACIQLITLNTDSIWKCTRRHFEIDGSLFLLDSDRLTATLKEAHEKEFSDYLPSIKSLFADGSILPHLKSLNWRAHMPIPTFIFNDFARSSIQHLKLVRVGIDEEFAVELPSGLARQKWPLQSLDLDIEPQLLTCEDEELGVARFSTSILRLCAPTLEFFRWNTWHGVRENSFLVDGLGPVPRFPRLRSLVIRNVNFLDHSILDAMLQDNIRRLDVDTEWCPPSVNFFQNRGTIPSLETFVWSSENLLADQSLDFLRANPQLSKLSLRYPAPNFLLEQQMLPLLVTSFSGLKSPSGSS